MNEVWPKEVTVSVDNANVQIFAYQINPESPIIKVPMTSRLRPFGNCYWNVNQVVKESGGSVQLGWLLTWWPDLFISAMHHAIWRSPKNVFYDVTEKVTTDSIKEHSVFVCDSSEKIDLEIEPHITTRFFILFDDPRVFAFRAAYESKNRAERDLGALLYKCGDRCEYNFALAKSKNAQLNSLSPTDKHIIYEYNQILNRIKNTKFELGSCIEQLNLI